MEVALFTLGNVLVNPEIMLTDNPKKIGSDKLEMCCPIWDK